MDKLLRSFITIERTFQILALAGLILFLGYLGLSRFQKDQGFLRLIGKLP